MFFFEKLNHKCAKCEGDIRDISDNTLVKDYWSTFQVPMENMVVMEIS